MNDRRYVMAGLAALAAAPAISAERPLAEQPALPGPLSRYRELPVRRLDDQLTTLGRLLGPTRPSIVSFWATWCAPCALEGRRLARLRVAYADERLAIIGLNIETGVEPGRLEAFRRRAQMNYTQAVDGKAAYAAMTERSAAVLPRTYVFDAAGTPVAAFGRFFGERTLQAIDAAVRGVAGVA